jgi:hypothetical protein
MIHSWERGILWEILVPAFTNDGVKIQVPFHKEWDERVRKLAGGLTIMKTGIGNWINGNELYIERTIPIRIYCTKNQIDVIADITASHYGQKSIMYYALSDDVYIKRY